MISDPISHLDNNASSIIWVHCIVWGFPGGSTGKESTCNAGDLGSISGLGRSPGEEKSCPLQYSGQENSVDCIVHGVAKQPTKLSYFHISLVKSLLTVYLGGSLWTFNSIAFACFYVNRILF